MLAEEEGRMVMGWEPVVDGSSEEELGYLQLKG